MQIFLILALLIAIIAVIFAVQNVAIVTIAFFAWHIETSLAVALLLALGAGVLITVLVSLPGRLKSGMNSSSQKRKYSSLELERDQLKLKVEEALTGKDFILKKLEASEKEVAGLEEQLASISAALEEKDERQATVADTQPTAPPAEVLSAEPPSEPGEEKPVE